MADEQAQVSSQQRTIERKTPLPEGNMPPSANPPVTGCDSVTVACKIPAGIVFPLGKMVPFREPMMGGFGLEITKFEPATNGEVPVEVRLRGPAKDLFAMRRGKGEFEPIVGGYALTSGIPREHWEWVLEHYKHHPAILNGLVFAQKNEREAAAQAKDQRTLTSGLEGIDPDNPQKRTGIRNITKDVDRASAVRA
jgi:hypothetical protein